ncbi:DUF2141 domain-containing protein [Caulobacter hibisci]|uniref:DUF2141 domain-containing protein n=1 Tax=Caulobacter hibisci TaxID=2035993 RepID=A0ABS0T4M5_9CAUL|nr:DUF2141 domain-containing protein [Caulobacter hibisci]
MKSVRTSILAFFAALAATGVANAASVEVRVSGVANAKGQIVVSACDKATFLKTCPYNVKVPAALGAVTAKIANLPPGSWSFLAFHDQDGDGVMKKTALGLPADGVGLSRDPKARFGPPKFDDSAVEVGAGGASVSIGLKY